MLENEQNQDHGHLVTPAELSKILGLPTWRISRWRSRGLIPSVKMGRTNYYNVDHVIKTLNRREKLGRSYFQDTGYARNQF